MAVMLVFAPISISGTQAGLALAAAGALWGWRETTARLRTPLDAPILAFLGVTLLSALASDDPGGSVRRFAGSWTILALYLVAGWLASVERAERFLLLLLPPAAVFGAYGIVQHFTGVNLFGSGGPMHSLLLGERQVYFPRGGFSHYQTYANVFFVIFCLAAAWRRRQRTARGRALRGAAAAFLAVVVVFTFTRGIWISLLAALAILAWVFARRASLVARGRGRRGARPGAAGPLEPAHPRALDGRPRHERRAPAALGDGLEHGARPSRPRRRRRQLPRRAGRLRPRGGAAAHDPHPRPQHLAPGRRRARRARDAGAALARRRPARGRGAGGARGAAGREGRGRWRRARSRHWPASSSTAWSRTTSATARRRSCSGSSRASWSSARGRRPAPRRRRRAARRSRRERGAAGAAGLAPARRAPSTGRPSWWSATSWSTATTPAGSAASRPRRRCRSSKSPRRASAAAARRTSRATSAASARRSRSAGWSGRTRRATGCARNWRGAVSASPASSRTPAGRRSSSRASSPTTSRSCGSTARRRAARGRGAAAARRRARRRLGARRRGGRLGLRQGGRAGAPSWSGCARSGAAAGGCPSSSTRSPRASSSTAGRRVVTPNLGEALAAAGAAAGPAGDVERAGAALARRARGRGGPRDARGARDEPLRAGPRPRCTSRPSRARSSTSPARETRWSACWRWRSPRGATLPAAARLANLAAGVVVGEFGTVPVTREQLLAPDRRAGGARDAPDRRRGRARARRDRHPRPPSVPRACPRRLSRTSAGSR